MADVNTRKRGTKWEYYFESAKIENKRSRVSKGGFSTKKKALEAGVKALSEYNNAGLHFIPSELSFSDYLDYWLKEYCQNNLKPVTVANYEKKVRLHIKPQLGKYKLKTLTPSVLNTFLNDMFNEGYSRTTLSVIKGILSGSLSYAVEPLRYIQNSPMLYVKLPASRATPSTPTRYAPHIFIPKEKMEEIFTRFPEGTSTFIPMQFGYLCGMRIGEAFAVTWEDVDLNNKTIDINKQVQWSETNKVWYFTKPKYESCRIIEINDDLTEILKREHAKQLKAKEYYDELYTLNYVNEKEYLNTNKDGKLINLVTVRENGEFITPRTMQHTSSVIHHKMNYPEFDFHSLRHTHATLLVEKGVSLKYIQTRLGHKNVYLTIDTYQHITEEMLKQAKNILNTI